MLSDFVNYLPEGKAKRPEVLDPHCSAHWLWRPCLCFGLTPLLQVLVLPGDVREIQRRHQSLLLPIHLASTIRISSSGMIPALSGMSSAFTWADRAAANTVLLELEPKTLASSQDVREDNVDAAAKRREP